jgi:hypothetical protein
MASDGDIQILMDSELTNFIDSVCDVDFETIFQRYHPSIYGHLMEIVHSDKKRQSLREYLHWSMEYEDRVQDLGVVIRERNVQGFIDLLRNDQYLEEPLFRTYSDISKNLRPCRCTRVYTQCSQ